MKPIFSVIAQANADCIVRLIQDQEAIIARAPRTTRAKVAEREQHRLYEILVKATRRAYNPTLWQQITRRCLIRRMRR